MAPSPRTGVAISGCSTQSTGETKGKALGGYHRPVSDDRKVTEVEPITVQTSPALAAIAIVNDDALHEVGPGALIHVMQRCSSHS